MNQILIYKDCNLIVSYHMVHPNLKILINYVLMTISCQSNLILPLLCRYLRHLIKIVFLLINTFEIVVHIKIMHQAVLETSKIKIHAILQFMILIQIISNKIITHILIVFVNNNLVIILKIGVIPQLKIANNKVFSNIFRNLIKH
jgi:hypothetical protein